MFVIIQIFLCRLCLFQRKSRFKNSQFDKSLKRDFLLYAYFVGIALRSLIYQINIYFEMLKNN